MKPPVWTLVVIVALLCCIPGAWWLGQRSGIREGAKAGAWHGNVFTLAMILSSRAVEDEGDTARAREYIDDALYLSASSLEINQDSTALTEGNRAAGEELLMSVADYYWKHPETYDLEEEEESNPPSDPLEAAIAEAMEPLFEVGREHQRRTKGILLRYKPSNEQDADRKRE